MGSRLELHEELCVILGSREVYFQPPSSVQMKYPAIIYSRKSIDNTSANNTVYKQDDSYELTVIDPDPDSELVRKISKLPMCRHDRHYKQDGLNHDTFTLYLS
jgi:hypothetical protein